MTIRYAAVLMAGLLCACGVDSANGENDGAAEAQNAGSQSSAGTESSNAMGADTVNTARADDDGSMDAATLDLVTDM